MWNWLIPTTKTSYEIVNKNNLRVEVSWYGEEKKKDQKLSEDCAVASPFPPLVSQDSFLSKGNDNQTHFGFKRYIYRHPLSNSIHSVHFNLITWKKKREYVLSLTAWLILIEKSVIFSIKLVFNEVVFPKYKC